MGWGVHRWVERDFRSYLRCGILAHGFARVRCTDCGHDRLLAFSCKLRGVCPSCNARRMAEVAAYLTDEVIPLLPLRQWVLSVPKRLRRGRLRSHRGRGPSGSRAARPLLRPGASRPRAAPRTCRHRGTLFGRRPPGLPAPRARSARSPGASPHAPRAARPAWPGSFRLPGCPPLAALLRPNLTSISPPPSTSPIPSPARSTSSTSRRPTTGRSEAQAGLLPALRHSPRTGPSSTAHRTIPGCLHSQNPRPTLPFRPRWAFGFPIPP
jgi:hypothetical protein